jgi:hypothetical protein
METHKNKRAAPAKGGYRDSGSDNQKVPEKNGAVNGKKVFDPFIPSILDDAGLLASEFRVYCHISRRGQCFGTINDICEHCRLNEHTVRKALSKLLKLGAIFKEERPGRTTLYETQPLIKWATGGLIKRATATPYKKSNTKEVPRKVIHSKEDDEEDAERRSAILLKSGVQPADEKKIAKYFDGIGSNQQCFEAFMEYNERKRWLYHGEQIHDWRTMADCWVIKWKSRSNWKQKEPEPLRGTNI